MPRIRQTSIVSSSETNRLFSPTLRMKPAKLEAAPVSVSTPMITPTTAQAMPTPSACLAPSMRLARSDCSVARPPRTQKQAATSTAISSQHRLDAPLQERRRGQADRDPEHVAKGGGRELRRQRRAEDEDGRQREADHAGEHRREAVEEHVDERGERQHQVPVRVERRATDSGTGPSAGR